jgi:hypothetical protein
MCKLASHPHSTNVLLISKGGTQNGKLDVKPHVQILQVHDTTLCNR